MGQIITKRETLVVKLKKKNKKNKSQGAEEPMPCCDPDVALHDPCAAPYSGTSCHAVPGIQGLAVINGIARRVELAGRKSTNSD